jgi:hypothetical protein
MKKNNVPERRRHEDRQPSFDNHPVNEQRGRNQTNSSQPDSDSHRQQQGDIRSPKKNSLADES